MGTKGNRKHGLYGAYLSEAERSEWDALPLGDVDNEIRMIRVWLGRALALETTIPAAPGPNGTELVEMRRSSASEDGLTRTDVVTRRPDVAGRVDKLLGRLAQLERTRAELLAAAQASGEGAGDKARDLVETIRAIRRLDDADE